LPTYNELLITGFERACEHFPDHTALIYLGERYGYREILNLIDRFATALHDLGVKKNDKVMIYIPNCPQFIIAYFGAQRIGAVPVPVSPIYTPHEVKYLITDAEAETIVCLDTNFRYVQEVFAETGLKRVIVTTYVDMLPWYKRAIGLLFDKIPKGVVKKGATIFCFKDLIRNHPPSPPRVDLNPDSHLCYIL
jgi:long-chain acyl-CoA synthetase